MYNRGNFTQGGNENMAKYCSNCGAEVKGKFCESCGTEVGEENTAGNQNELKPNNPVNPPKKKKKSHGCLIVVIAVFVFFGVIGATVLGGIGQNKLIQKQVSGVSSEDEYITKEAYKKIETGMSYDEVKKIVGSEGEISSQVESNGIKIVIVTWYGNGVAGSNANVTFTNDEVTGKAQVGLK